ncbi:3-dehydroquinate dehydratase [Glaciecola pallidula DSM 14239 = ACAM 615]|jgi:3-dehydroquinate dehydratase-2|uniref:3-dehydroquinate dehydratase n=2 Tax=Brumicola TaxID=3160924 RepID=K6YUF0_9ALTE|nr:3-dehydroquinate dehydratase [Glaciecola pallidula DSM 14239 = ACAM 615]
MSKYGQLNDLINENISILMNILVLNGPNLNLLGKREPEVYGSKTLDVILADLTGYANSQNVMLFHFQSNAEHELIDRIQSILIEGAASNAPIDAIIINPAAFTHTSVALRDALLAVNLPFIEVHLSNVHKRESFRHHSYFSDIAQGVIVGLGEQGYRFALDALITTLQNKSKN